MRQEFEVRLVTPQHNSVGQLIGHRVMLSGNGDIGSRLEIGTSSPDASRLFTPGRQLVLELSTADGSPLIPPPQGDGTESAQGDPQASPAASAESPADGGSTAEGGAAPAAA